MAVYLKKFETHTQYETYINGSGAILPNVSICTTEGDVHYNPYVPEPIETRVVAKFNVTDTSSPTRIASATTAFSSIEIDGVEQPSVTTGYTFSTTGIHTVKYTLKNPSRIGDRAFMDCSNLTSIDIPDSVTSIGSGVCSGCTSLTTCTIGSGVTNIRSHAFDYCSGLTRLNSNVDGVFNLPSSVTIIGDYAFNYCRSITSIDIPDSVTSIGGCAFENCIRLTSIDIPSGVTSIGNYTFHNCGSLTSCTIGGGVTSIGIQAFQSCIRLTSIVIPSGITTIGNQAFQYCSSLTSITSNATTAPTIQSSTFRDVKTGGTLRVPIGSSGYDVWMGTSNYYLGKYNWTKVEQ